MLNALQAELDDMLNALLARDGSELLGVPLIQLRYELQTKI